MESISDLCKLAKNTKYEQIFSDILQYTEDIENAYKAEHNKEEFRDIYTMRFYNLFSILLKPIKSNGNIAESTDNYIILKRNHYNIKSVNNLSVSVFIDGVIYYVQPNKKTSYEIFQQKIKSFFPDDVTIDFVCNTSDCLPVLSINNKKYIVDFSDKSSVKLKLILLDFSLIPSLTQTDKQSQELHLYSFVRGFISTMYKMYNASDWLYVTDELNTIIINSYLEHCRIHMHPTDVPNSRIKSAIEEVALHTYNFNFSKIAFFRDDNTKLKLRYMQAFCQLFSQYEHFPTQDMIIDAVNSHK